jgi:hypothetical protein
LVKPPSSMVSAPYYHSSADRAVAIFSSYIFTRNR